MAAERLKGITNAGLVSEEIKEHVRRTIELDPGRAQALQMMGGLYAELPWLLGGSEKEAESYLRRAIAADGGYTNAHLTLAWPGRRVRAFHGASRTAARIM